MALKVNLTMVSSKAAFTPRWQVTHGKRQMASGKPHGVPCENENPETYETFHTEVAWHVTCATCNMPRHSGVGPAHYFLMCNLPPWTTIEEQKHKYCDESNKQA
ncbi:hypothetical protein E2C01_030568 [Portunus trituberculatus]|uniref:Uncharacterized protein n=1 Tax=Portunus trituberculatus TaxID=210409 RepID=A0A5B7EXP1_PORTR|nr:hypothetical protein [Portunus trituberculatus]